MHFTCISIPKLNLYSSSMAAPEAEVKEEMLAPEEDERPWWVKDLAMLAAARHPDDPEDEPGLHVLQARLLKEPQPMDETLALVWSAEESGVLVDLTKDDDGAPAGEEGCEGRGLATGSSSGGGGCGGG
jgi:hypothetical protein